MPQPSLIVAFLPQLGVMEMVVVMGIAVLLFGKRLPEVGRSLGRGLVEFKKGLNGIHEELDLSSLGNPTSPARRYEEPARGSGSYGASSSSSSSSHYADSSVPKFEPPTSAPVPQMEYDPAAENRD